MAEPTIKLGVNVGVDHKPGYKTTEFWVTLATMAAAIINQSGLLKFQLPVDTVGQVVTAAAVYVGSRSVLKTAGALMPALMTGKSAPAKLNE